MQKNWYVIQVLSSQEKKVKHSIEEQKGQSGFSDYIDTVLLPVENVSEVKDGTQKIVEKKLWPGYLLVYMHLNDESWAFVKGIQGVFDFLGGDKPVALSQQEVDEILKDLEDKKLKVTQKHKFEVGNVVKIVDGVFVNFTGTVTEIFQEKGRLSVLVSIFGRDTQVDDLEFIQVEQVTDSALNQ